MRLLALALVALAGCGRPAPRTFRIAAAPSFRTLLERMAPSFEARHPELRVTWSFDASSMLARQIADGAPYEVILAADRESLAPTGVRIRPDTHQAFLANRLALLEPEPPESPETWAICAPEVPAGRAWSKVVGGSTTTRRCVTTDNVRAALALFESGAATHACVYETDARLAKRPHRVTFPNAPDVVGFAAPVGTPSAAATDFLAWIRTPEFLREAEALGFRPPPPK
ncbi:MAG: substrate-binding domain-containing protein [Planctomycetes bacterium]|nr:substrate-binding domain-containing protein [Planctomycetota bacterium]